MFKTIIQHYDLNDTKYEKKNATSNTSQLIRCGSSTSNGCEASRTLQNLHLHLALHLQSDQEKEKDQLLHSSSQEKAWFNLT